MVRLHIIMLVVLIGKVGTVLAQPTNLVYNGSFEKYTLCPDSFETKKSDEFVKGWVSPNVGTPDYFNACSEKSGVPLNWVGSADAFDGLAYVGIIACMYQMDPHQIAYREYLRTTLLEPLDSGRTYYASMQVRHGLSCNTACNGLGMHFSANNLQTVLSSNYPLKADVFLEGDPIIDKADGWTKVCGNFVATGEEQYLIIGNFLSNQSMDFYALDENYIPTRHVSPMAYYYIDDVEVYIVDSVFDMDCKNIKKNEILSFAGTLPVGERLILSNLYFEVDEAIILQESFPELEELSLVLKRKNTLRISINGHTDNTGSDEHNQSLSLSRANAVKDYLLAQGVSRFAMVVKGYGNAKPIANNDSNEGRKQNRRVEIEVLKN